MRKLVIAMTLAVLSLGAAACGGGDAPSAEETASAVPGMQESVAPTLGTGVTEAPSE